MKHIRNLHEVSLADVKIVGGKNASLGEMIKHLSHAGVRCPSGIATTISAYNEFILQNHLNKKISNLIASINLNHINKLDTASKKIRELIIASPFSREFISEMTKACGAFKNQAVAVRSSASTEDLSDASFAGAQETFLNIRGIKNILLAVKMVYASLFTSRAIAYRRTKGYDLDAYGISVGIQPMIRSDIGTSGVLFTLDTESGFDKIIMISASYGLGEAVVQGLVNADEFIVYKPALESGQSAILQRTLGNKTIKMIYAKSNHPRKAIKIIPVKKADQLHFCINDKDIEILAKQALLIEKHYGKPMDIEWAKDGNSGKIFILQARPETVKSKDKKNQVLEHYTLNDKGKLLVTGQSIGQCIGQGTARVLSSPKQMESINPGDVLVTDMTDPDWEPIMKMASAIVTNRGGRTCHAAIIARELGIPAVIGCNNATKVIKNNQFVTVSCAQGQIGYVYEGQLAFSIKKIAIDKMPKLPIDIYINMGNPEKAFAAQLLPNNGVGLARLEFIIANMIGIHPNAAININKLSKPLQKQIKLKTAAYQNPIAFYIEKLREGISVIAAAFYPKPVIFRFSDFKTNEYASLLGGEFFEPKEENPMIGWRGASRYKDKHFKDAFALECKAFKIVRDKMGLTNAEIMIPFVRTVNELKDLVALIEQHGLKRGKNGLKLYMMCEIPANVILANEFLNYVDGFSIGSNDLTQLTLGLDRDSHLVSDLFDERNEAVKILLHQAIKACKKRGKYIGICGQAPSDHPDLAKWLMQEGIESISLNPDTVIETWLSLSKKK